MDNNNTIKQNMNQMNLMKPINNSEQPLIQENSQNNTINNNNNNNDNNTIANTPTQTDEEKKVEKLRNFYKKLNLNEIEPKEFFSNELENNNIVENEILKKSLYILSLGKNILKNFDYNNKNIYKNLETICIIFQNSKDIIKFPKIYLHFITKFTEFLINKYKENKDEMDFKDKKNLYENLIKLGNFRKLNDIEENIFFELINDNKFTNVPGNSGSSLAMALSNVNNEYGNIKKNSNDKNFISINLSKEKQLNYLINFSYKIKNIEKTQFRHVLELIEYNFKFETTLTKEKIKFNEIEFHFLTNYKNVKNKEKNILIKSFKINDELSNENPLLLEYKILEKSEYPFLLLKEIVFTLEKTPYYIYNIKFNDNKENVIFYKQLDKKILEFNYPKKVKVGVEEYYNLEIEFNKDIIYDDIEIEELNINFKNLPKKQINFFEEKNNYNNISKSLTINNNNNMNNNPLLSKNYSLRNYLNNYNVQNNNNSLNNNLSFKKNIANNNINPNINNMYQSVNIDNINNMMGQKNMKIKLPEPEFYTFNKEKNALDKFIDGSGSFKINNIDIKNDNKISFLIRFLENGDYQIKINIIYRLLKKELKDDFFDVIENFIIDFKVVQPFSIRYETFSNIYMSISGKQAFPIKKNIKYNLILTNNLDDDFILKEAKTCLNNELNNVINIDNSYIDSLLELNKENEEKNNYENEYLITILKSSDYCIPFNINFLKEFQGNFGNFNIKWTSKLLNNFIKKNKINIYNENIFKFPFTYIKDFDLEINYNNNILNTNLVDYNINIKNNSNKVKKILFLMENNNDIHFYKNGRNKKNLILKPFEKTNLNFNLYAKYKGSLKLPSFKIFDLFIFKSNYDKKEPHDEKLYSIYYIPNNIDVE